VIWVPMSAAPLTAGQVAQRSTITSHLAMVHEERRAWIAAGAPDDHPYVTRMGRSLRYPTGRGVPRPSI
jgi:hypothetical protein